MNNVMFSKSLDFITEKKAIRLSKSLQQVSDWQYVTDEQADLFYNNKMIEGKRRKEGALELEDDPNYTPPPTAAQLLDEALTAKNSEIDVAMGQNVCTEFSCSALGSVHSYDCRDVDQKNIAQAIRIAESSGSEQYLAKETGQFFSMTSHTLAQLKEVDAAMFAHISANRTIARRKKVEAVAAHESGDIEAVKAVDVSNWT